ncbi:hypothetical protein JAAARDRAFT_216661 [Jaapia argillacea MUCL 33604]|uniref:Secreted protein n=1 Tax=Jaapia argillacea MUCL 33604 TaxID=933084 RepID=A0A067QD67_9AGAM|nr:hypothetical protein JAAARDRAFT_216661 [Jaapia argillacea MUCL 33604]
MSHPFPLLLLRLGLRFVYPMLSSDSFPVLPSLPLPKVLSFQRMPSALHLESLAAGNCRQPVRHRWATVHSPELEAHRPSERQIDLPIY